MPFPQEILICISHTGKENPKIPRWLTLNHSVHVGVPRTLSPHLREVWPISSFTGTWRLDHPGSTTPGVGKHVLREGSCVCSFTDCLLLLALPGLRGSCDRNRITHKPENVCSLVLWNKSLSIWPLTDTIARSLPELDFPQPSGVLSGHPPLVLEYLGASSSSAYLSNFLPMCAVGGSRW